MVWEGLLDSAAESTAVSPTSHRPDCPLRLPSLHPVLPLHLPPFGKVTAGQGKHLSPPVLQHCLPGTEVQHRHCNTCIGVNMPYGTFTTPGASGISILPVLDTIGLGPQVVGPWYQSELFLFSNVVFPKVCSYDP